MAQPILHKDVRRRDTQKREDEDISVKYTMTRRCKDQAIHNYTITSMASSTQDHRVSHLYELANWLQLKSNTTIIPTECMTSSSQNQCN